jgi:type II secretory pathway component PulF
MPIFKYKVRDRDGGILSGTLEGTDVATIVERLDDLGYIPITIAESKGAKPGGGTLGSLDAFITKLFAPKVKPSDLINFTRQFVTLHKAGLPMLSAVGALQNQTRNKTMINALDMIRKDLMGGASLSAAMQKFPSIFSELYVNSVWAGETGGVLDDILTRLCELLEHERKMRSEVMSAMRYPIMVIIAFGIAILVLSTFVLPKFVDMLSKVGGTLPLPTKILIVFTDFMKTYWYILLLAMGGVAALFYLFIRTRDGRLWWDRAKLKLPIFGDILFKMTLSRFSRMFETLDRTGLPILRSLSLVAKTTGNAYIGGAIDKLGESVRRGRGLAAPMRESGVFPPMVVQMVATGEESGALDDMLHQVSDYYDSEVEYAVKNLTAMIEPVLILVLGLGVVFLIIAIIMPYMSILSNFGGGGVGGAGAPRGL